MVKDIVAKEALAKIRATKAVKIKAPTAVKLQMNAQKNTGLPEGRYQGFAPEVPWYQVGRVR
jgi:hypothetical protein